MHQPNFLLYFRYHDIFRCLPKTKRHFSIDPPLTVIASCTPFIQVFFGRPFFFLSIGIHSIRSLGNLCSGILLTWPYYCNLFFSTGWSKKHRMLSMLCRMADWSLFKKEPMSGNARMGAVDHQNVRSICRQESSKQYAAQSRWQTGFKLCTSYFIAESTAAALSSTHMIQ